VPVGTETEIKGQIFRIVDREPAQPLASVAVMVMLVPAPFVAVGVPDNKPAELNARPDGSVPLVRAKV
jgi:hypothetical protein